MKFNRSGFTLIELVVVISIIGILASVLLANLNEGSAQSRDAKRQADLRAIQSAVELYKNENGRYPEGCNGPDVWSGQLDSDYECSRAGGVYDKYNGTSQYIIGHEIGLVFAPKFIRVIPTDQKLNGTDSGYVYKVNVDGSVYKFMALNTVEAETIGDSHPFHRCGPDFDRSNGDPNSSMCIRARAATNDADETTTHAECTTLSHYSNVYAVSGGYSRGEMYAGLFLDTPKNISYWTELIRCK